MSFDFKQFINYMFSIRQPTQFVWLNKELNNKQS